MPRTWEVTEFLVKKQVVFICDRCGQVIEMFVPEDGESRTKRYCCGQGYRVSTLSDGELYIVGVESEMERELNAEPVMEKADHP